jgi:hypothetical protein
VSVDHFGEEFVVCVEKCDGSSISDVEGVTFPFVDGCYDALFELFQDKSSI